MVSFIGVDVSSEVLDIFAQRPRGSRQFPNTSPGIGLLVRWVTAAVGSAEAHLIIEPTSTYHHLLIEALRGQGIRYTLINPARTSMFARLQGKRAKTDRIDARLLAELGEQERPHPTESPSHDQEELKALRRHREWLEQEAQAVANRRDSAHRSPWTPKEVLESLDRTLGELRQEVQRLDQAIEEHVGRREDLERDVQLLTSIPGVGRRTAIMLLSELPPESRCRNAKSWVAFCGLNPEPRESGRSRWSRLSRMGAARVRGRLYLAAVTALRWNPPIRALGERLKARGKAGKVRVVAAMNKLLRICFGVLRSGRPFDLSLHTTPIS